MCIEPKKLALLRIWQILNKYSDEDHLLTHQNIIDKLNVLYGIDLGRKAVKYNIELLKEADIDVIETPKGSYMGSRTFEDSELHLLIDSVFGNNAVRQNYTDDLIKKLCSLTSENFTPHTGSASAIGGKHRSNNAELFNNIDCIHHSIEKGRNITYDYNMYGTDKELYKTSTQTVSPYRLLFHNMGYYLMAFDLRHQELVFHRIDHMTNMIQLNERITPISSIPDFDPGKMQAFFDAARPYMFSDPAERVEMLVDNIPSIVNQIIDWFGRDINIEELENDEYGRLRVNFLASPLAMKHWALQYMDHVEIVEPEVLRDMIRDSIIMAKDKYER